MANDTIFIRGLPTGQAGLTARIVTRFSDTTIVTGRPCTELTNGKQDYTCTTNSAGVTGWHRLYVATSGGTYFFNSWVNLRNDGGNHDTTDTLPEAADGTVFSNSSVAIAAALEGDTVTIQRGDTVSIAFTDLGNITNRTKLWFTVKAHAENADTASIIQVTEAGGLIYLNEAAAAVSAQATLTVTDATAGNVTIVLLPAATLTLKVVSALFYDVQVLRSTGAVNTLSSGRADVVADITRAVS